MRYIIKFVRDNRIMIITNADRTIMEFTSEALAQKKAWAFEDQYPEIHYVVPR